MPLSSPTRSSSRAATSDDSGELQHDDADFLSLVYGRLPARVAAMFGGRQPADADLHGADPVMPHYNVMGVAKAALQARTKTFTGSEPGNLLFRSYH